MPLCECKAQAVHHARGRGVGGTRATQIPRPPRTHGPGHAPVHPSPPPVPPPPPPTPSTSPPAPTQI
eukprot:3264794-Pyramimonas_sp.AAC.1